MTRSLPARRLLVLLVILFFLVPTDLRAGAGTTPSSADVLTPNVVFILLDDLGYADLGSYGSEFIQTPTIDTLAAEGMRFTRYYVATPLCTPSRVGLITGHYASQYGLRTAYGDRGIPDYVTNLAHLFKSVGYSTGHVGKWHLGMESQFAPSNQGFDQGVRFRSELAWSTSYWNPLVTIDNEVVVEHEGHLTEILTDYALDFIDDHSGAPFFLNLWYWNPHVPLEPPPEWAELYPDTDEGKFAALVSNVDEQIARLMTRLGDLGLDHDTLVILASDNGGVIKWHGPDPTQEPSNGIFRGGKRQGFEGGIRVPMIARWPGVVEAGVADNSVIAGVDLLPTLAELVGVDVTALAPHGESFLGVLLDSQPKVRSGSLFWEVKRKGQLFESEVDIWNTFAVLHDNWKLVFEFDTYHLFDLEVDPEESTNLADSNPAKLAELLAEHTTWRLETGLLAHSIDSTVGDVVVNGDSFELTNGMITLEKEALCDIRDLDFSFAASLTPAEIGGLRLIGTNRDTWRLYLRNTGVLRLVLTDEDNVITTLDSVTALQPGQTYDVAFTIFSWDKSPNLVRLYVDQQLEVEFSDLGHLMPSQQAIRIGNTPDLSRPFTGTIDNLQLYTLNLHKDELALVFPPRSGTPSTR